MTDINLGYNEYVQGKKIPKDASADFITGWWNAYDKGDMFGKYESFLQAPDRYEGEDYSKPKFPIPTEIMGIIRSGLYCLEATDNSMSGRPTAESIQALEWLDQNTDYADD